MLPQLLRVVGPRSSALPRHTGIHRHGAVMPKHTDPAGSQLPLPTPKTFLSLPLPREPHAAVKVPVCLSRGRGCNTRTVP